AAMSTLRHVDLELASFSVKQDAIAQVEELSCSVRRFARSEERGLPPVVAGVVGRQGVLEWQRMGAVPARQIVQPRTARSQLMGGVIWGLSSALHEATELDERAGRYVNTNLADYLIPVNADIQTIDVILVPETDDWVNPLGVKGLGELGNVGVN